MAFELLKSAIIEPPKNFFSNEFKSSKNSKDKKYYERVLSLDPQGKADRLRGSIEFQKSIGAMTEDDQLLYESINRFRNKLAHDTLELLSLGENKNYQLFFDTCKALHIKISRWWIVNVEMATDPDFLERSVELETDEVFPFSALSLEILTQIVGNDPEKAYFYYKKFKEMKES